MSQFSIGPRLKDKVAIVTGVASGIGATTTELFLAHGARVYALDLEEDGISSEATFVKCNVTDEEDWKAAIATVKGSAGRIDVLFKQPTPEVAYELTLHRIQGFLATRFHNEQTFRLT